MSNFDQISTTLNLSFVVDGSMLKLQFFLYPIKYFGMGLHVFMNDEKFEKSWSILSNKSKFLFEKESNLTL